MAKRLLGRQYEPSLEDGPKYAQYPDEYHPVAYRVMITGIYVTDSGFDPDESEGYIEDVVQDLVRTGSADMRLFRLTDAPEVTDAEREQWQAQRLKEARQSLCEQRAPESSFDQAVKAVTGIYEAQGIIPAKSNGGSE